MDNQTESNEQAVVEDQHSQGQVPPPGGAAARGPSPINPGGTFDPDGLVPPYEDRSAGDDSVTGLTAESSAEMSYDASNAGEPGPGRVESAEEQAGVSGTDTTAATPLGVGVSSTDRGEDIAEDDKEGTKGATDRPYGKSGAGEETGLG